MKLLGYFLPLAFTFILFSNSANAQFVGEPEKSAIQLLLTNINKIPKNAMDPAEELMVDLLQEVLTQQYHDIEKSMKKTTPVAQKITRKAHRRIMKTIGETFCEAIDSIISRAKKLPVKPKWLSAAQRAVSMLRSY